MIKPHAITLAVACLLAASPAVFAQSVAVSDTTPVVITGSRFPNAPDLAPIGAVVITASEIRIAGIDNVNEAIRKLAGVYGRQNLYGTQDYDLDLNGFGSDSQNNLVVLVDGVRLSENEQSPAMLSTIPIDSVARIEIMHSGSGVLYGDGATGGVIQIITKQMGSTPLTGSIFTELGQFNDHLGRVNLAKGGDNFNASLNFSEQKSNNYRNNSDVTQKNASGAITWYSDIGRAGIRVDIARQDSGFAGSLSLAQFQQNPRQATTPADNGSIATDRYTAFVEYNFSSWQLAAELSTRQRTADYDLVSFQSMSGYSGRQTQFTPRLRNLTTFDAMTNELVFGADFTDWNRQTNSAYALTDAKQKSKAFYLRDEVKIGQARFAAGARRELFDKTSSDAIVGSVDNYSVVQGVNAWELESSYAFAPVVNVFAKAGQSYRVANVDDNGYTLLPNTPLLPQLSHDLEVGATLGDANQQVTGRWFRHDLTNEIYYDPTANLGYGANTNLAPTRRQGVALEAKLRLAPEWRLSAQAQHVDAKFIGGPEDGLEMVLVPKNTLSTHVNWLPGDGQSAYIGAQWVDTQRYGGDFTNTCAALVPAHESLDARYAKTFGAWELAVTGTNLTNKQFFTNAYGCMSGIYPDDGRQMKLSLRYSF